METLDELRREYTVGLWWIDWCRAFWGNLGRAAIIKGQLDGLTNEWNTIKREFKVRGRPRGARNLDKAPTGAVAEIPATPGRALEDIFDSL